MKSQNGSQDQNRTLTQSPINLPALAWYPRGIADSTTQRINNRQLWATFSFSNDQRLRITKNIASLNSNKICPSKRLALKTLAHSWAQHCPHKSELPSFHSYNQSKKWIDRIKIYKKPLRKANCFANNQFQTDEKIIRNYFEKNSFQQPNIMKLSESQVLSK